MNKRSKNALKSWGLGKVVGERGRERDKERKKERKKEKMKKRERKKGEVVGSRRLVIRKKKIRLETKVLAINLFLSFIVG